VLWVTGGVVLFLLVHLAGCKRLGFGVVDGWGVMVL